MADAADTPKPGYVRTEYDVMSGSRLGRGRLPLLATLGFGAGSVATTLFVVAPQLLLLFYMTELLAIPAGWAGLALVIPKIWEVVTDPWLGWLSDRTTTRWGRRRPFLLAGALLFPPALALMFAAPVLADWPARLAFVTGAYIAATTAYSLFAVPYVALPADLADQPQERTRLVAFRMAFVAVGILVAGAGAPALVAAWGGNREAYAALGLTLAGVSVIAMLATVGAAGHARIERGVRSESLLAGLRGIGRAQGFRSLGLAYLLQMASTGANAAMLAYAARYLFGGGEATVGIVFGLFTLASLLATPVFAMLAKRWGKHGGLVKSTWAYAGAMLVFAIAVPTGQTVLYAAAVLAGIANAGTQLFAFSLLPDVVEADRHDTGVAREGLFTGVWIAGEKLGLAAGAAFAGVVLQGAGFVEGASATQPQTALLAIALMFSILPAVLMAVSLVPLRRYADQEPNHAR